MSGEYIDFCVDLKTSEGTPWLTVEATVLVHHNDALYSNNLEYEILSYWYDRDGSYEHISEGLTRDLIDHENEIGEQVFEKLVDLLGIAQGPSEESFGHYEYFGRAF